MSAARKPAPDHCGPVHQKPSVGRNLDAVHDRQDTHEGFDGITSGGGHRQRDTQTCFAAADSSPGPRMAATPTESPGRADSLLLLYADALDDLEHVRIATENRVRSLGMEGLEGSPEQERLAGLCDALRAMEHGAELELRRALRKHPLGPWVKRTIGVGEKQGARLLAAVGNPADRRTVSQLWAYCGYHVLNPGHHASDTQKGLAGVDPSSDPSQGERYTHPHSAGVAPSRRKGQKANWNATAKMRAYLVAESCIKHRTSPYRKVYDDGRAKYAEATHHHECVRCGPAGKPAPVGSPLSEGHKHARALRLVAKEVLKDLWKEAKGLA